ncbi:uncharacterized protein LOC135169898 [Diachasmimorpha longicaudata]|uniref:uncharacterized protein LOC135169898 n=1 Tax=Diachasmimorpha longicaudata TaxID=58733 RepID=UPI0030B91355
MKRGVQSVARTINLAQPKTCARPIKLEKLVNEEQLNSCVKGGAYACNSPRPVTVRVCTRRVYESTCATKMSDCPPAAPVHPPPSHLVTGLKLLMKGSIVAGLIYWTSAEGIWGDSSQTENLYYRAMATVAPALPDVPGIEQLPRIDKMTHNVYEGYNRAVVTLMHVLITVPTVMSQKIRDIVCPEDGEMEDDDGKK